MSRRNLLCVGIALVAVGSLLVGSAFAESIPITNASFEDQVLADGAYNQNTGTEYDWTRKSSSTSVFSLMVGVHNPPATIYTNAGGSGTPLGGDGTNTCFSIINNGYSGWVGAYQTTGSTFEAGYTYTLTAAVGIRLASTHYGETFFVRIIDAATSTTLAEYSGTTGELTLGRYVDKTVSYTVNAGDSAIGNGIGVMVGMNAPTTSGTKVIGFDNLRCSSELVPEPSTLALLATGLIGLLCYAWRKRK